MQSGTRAQSSVPQMVKGVPNTALFRPYTNAQRPPSTRDHDVVRNDASAAHEALADDVDIIEVSVRNRQKWSHLPRCRA